MPCSRCSGGWFGGGDGEDCGRDSCNLGRCRWPWYKSQKMDTFWIKYPWNQVTDDFYDWYTVWRPLGRDVLFCFPSKVPVTNSCRICPSAVGTFQNCFTKYHNWPDATLSIALKKPIVEYPPSPVLLLLLLHDVGRDLDAVAVLDVPQRILRVELPIFETYWTDNKLFASLPDSFTSLAIENYFTIKLVYW